MSALAWVQLDQLAALYQPTSMLTIENNQVQGAANIVAKYKVSELVAVFYCTYFLYLLSFRFWGMF